jgi:uncharacterized membrane protein HdeD (DUF308 family)
MSATAVRDQLPEVRSVGSVLMAAGAFSIAAGILAIVYPNVTMLALALFVGVGLIVLCLLSLGEAFATGSSNGSRALAAVLGLVGLIAVLVVLRRPGEALPVVLLALGIWLLASGSVRFLRWLEPRERRPFQMRAAICEILLGALILGVPDLILNAIAGLAGMASILQGAVGVYVGRRLHQLREPAAQMPPVD